MDAYGKVAYEGYCESSNGISLVSGATLPTWENLPEAIRVAWNLAAVRVADAVLGHYSPKH